MGKFKAIVTIKAYFYSKMVATNGKAHVVAKTESEGTTNVLGYKEPGTCTFFTTATTSLNYPVISHVGAKVEVSFDEKACITFKDDSRMYVDAASVKGLKVGDKRKVGTKDVIIKSISRFKVLTNIKEVK